MLLCKNFDEKIHGLRHLARILESGPGGLQLKMVTFDKDKDLNKKEKSLGHMARILKSEPGDLELQMTFDKGLNKKVESLRHLARLLKSTWRAGAQKDDF